MKIAGAYSGIVELFVIYNWWCFLMNAFWYLFAVFQLGYCQSK
jgi:hypothetical protein